MKQNLHWLALHGLYRWGAWFGVRRGDPQARLIADPAIKADPVPFFDELRASGPVVRCPMSYIVVDHAVAQNLLRSEDFRVLPVGSNLPTPIRWLERITRDEMLHPVRPPSLLAVEPPEHTRYRKRVSSVFTPTAVAALRDRVQRTALVLLDQLAGRLGAVDLIEEYCSQLPVTVISDILGVPECEQGFILKFGELAAPSLDIGLSWRQYRRAQSGLAGLNAWLISHIRQLRRTPGDDLMSQLVRSSDTGSAATYLSDTELVSIAGLVLTAGFETTMNLLGNGIHLLLDRPEHLRTLRQRPELWANAVEEIMRLESPVQLTGRVASKDTEVANVSIKRGEVVVIYLAAANRDPAVFADPHRFDIERSNANRHLALSGGRHFCLGAALGRAESQVGLKTFFDRFPDAQPAGAGTRRDTLILRGWSTLPVALGRPCR
ncbi:cytochrome P450 [Mycobacterium sp. 852002-40037_SCH5390672]|uniref:cytochrome P450 n=1 Tax=Mycobacterium sp. 852002-40037_SCH5390672 TaxID=1834089 RepID=UPI000804AE2C|nr:cytochrome P450 [Mycobacterium sp. 852002-40037_SCH5390672]OBB94665.1 cytochrome [Mycobacterium sp. 852002-40037_SCH5390672]